MITRLLFFTGLVLVLCVAGCSPRVATSTTTSMVHDTVTITETARPVEIKLPGDSVIVYQYIECDKETNKPKPFKTSAKSKRTNASVLLDANGNLTVKCKDDSLKEIIQAMDKTIFHLRHEEEKSKTIEPEYKTRRIDIICRWIAAIAVLLALVKLYFKFIKPF